MHPFLSFKFQTLKKGAVLRTFSLQNALLRLDFGRKDGWEGNDEIIFFVWPLVFRRLKVRIIVEPSTRKAEVFEAKSSDVTTEP